MGGCVNPKAFMRIDTSQYDVIVRIAEIAIFELE
jgi:hypothetical protein